MASGLPVIAAPEGGVRDHLRDGVNGVTYEAGDAAAMARAMVLLVNEWEFTRRLARSARRTAEALSWERELDRLDASYREVLRAVGGAGLRPRASGKTQVTVVPLPRSLSAYTRPPCASTRCFTIARPRPVPPSSRERDESAR